MKSIVIAAPASGSGKTTVTLALLAALRRRGYRAAPFKVGPDFIDPGHHASACGRPSYNLDSWMCGAEGVKRTFARRAAGADVAVVEGVMGLFDGARGDDDGGSTAEIARLLGAPVLLVVDAGGQARSVAALVKGFADFDPGLRFAGILLNRVSSPRHTEMVAAALASVPGLPPLLGCLQRAPEVEIPSRHLGLVTAEDAGRDGGYFERLADWLEAVVDVERLLGQIPPHPRPLSPGERGEKSSPGGKVRIAVARDAAFCFCYPENLARLEAAGAELAFFSPLADRELPAGCGGLYLPGGYPELHAAQLAANRSLLADIRAFAAAGRPVYAECGGLIYLSEGVDSPHPQPLSQGTRGGALPGERVAEGRACAPESASARRRGREHDFVGLFPARAVMLPRRKALGYRAVTFARDTLLGPAGTMARGHEFHYSELEMPVEIERVYRMERADGAALADEGYVRGSVLASYVHLHFGSNPGLAELFVENCRKFNNR